VLALSARAHRLLSHVPRHDDRGQATAEYALVLLGAAAVAAGVFAYANNHGLFTGILEKVLGYVTGHANQLK
jgi:hypothetical protein